MEVLVTKRACWTHHDGVVRHYSGVPESVMTNTKQELRIFGTAEAAPLILHKAVHSRNLYFVGSPRAALKATGDHERPSRAAIVQVCRNACTPQSTGGWHMLSQADFAHFTLLGERKPFTEYLGPGIEHPLADFFAFLCRTNPVDAQGFSNLAADIIDPRWFIQPLRPHRRSSFLSFLGVCPAVLAGDEKSKRADRCRLLIDTFLRGPGFLASGYSERADLKTRLSAVRRTAILLQDVWLAALSSHPEMRAVDHTLAVFEERDSLRRAWQEATAG